MKRPLLVMAGGFVLGEVLGLPKLSAAITGLAVVIMAAFIFAARKYRNNLFLGLLIFFILFGFWRGSHERTLCMREDALLLDGEKGSVTGKVERIRENNGRLELTIRPYDEDLRYLLIYADGNISGDESRLLPGMTICAAGKYSAFSKASNPGQFDYASYYRAQKLTYRFFADDITILNRKGNFCDRYRAWLYDLSCRLVRILDNIADPVDAGILKSLLLGDKSDMDADVRDLYQKNGISHLLAISGLHLSLISAVVYGILRRLGMGYGLSGLLGGGALISYCFMTGASTSSLRALIMVLLGYLAAFMGRTYDLLTALGAAAFLLFLDSPYQLTQSGPLLSFLAIIGIAASSYLNLQKDAGKAGFKDRLYNALCPSVCIQLATAPVILWHFFRFPLYGIIINLFVIPLMGSVVASGAAGMAAGMICLPLGRFFLGMAHYILKWYDLLCRFFEKLPLSSLLFGRPAPAQIIIYYAVLATLCCYFGRHDHDWEKSGKGTNVNKHSSKNIFCLLPLLLLLIPLPVTGCDILFMDVGQGDGILIRSAARTILIDGGSSSVSDLYGERLLPCLESMAISDIDYAMVSHGHSDHTSGLYMLLSGESPVHVKNLILPAGGRGDVSYEKLTERAQNAGTKVFWMEKGDVLDFGKMRLCCIYPADSKGFPPEDANRHSLVLRLDYGGFSMLTGGDMTSEDEAAILADTSIAPALLNTAVLKISHHGSSTSSSAPWIDAVTPGWAVVSYGKGNSYGHPSTDIMTALYTRNIIVYETAKSGAISLHTDGRKIRWSEFGM